MVRHVIPAAIVLLILTTPAGAAERDPCQSHLRELQAEQTSRCGGMGELLNPSGCIAARNKLKTFDLDRCRQERPQAERGTKSPVPAGTVLSPLPAAPPLTKPVGLPTSDAAPQAEIDRLRQENGRLRQELDRCRAAYPQ